MNLKNFLDNSILYIAWLVAIAATSGSLIFSEVFGFTPCSLCWYQRIAMYPLVLIIPIGILAKDKRLSLYALPLSLVGIIIAFIHNLLQLGIISETGLPCQIGISCATKQINYFGFITIPFLSLVSFVLISFCLLYYWRLKR